MSSEMHFDPKNTQYDCLSESEVEEFDDFEAFIQMNAFNPEKIIEIISFALEKFYLLSITNSFLSEFFLEHVENVITWGSGHVELWEDIDYDSDLLRNTTEEYVLWLLRNNRKIIILIPKDFFTYFTKNKKKTNTPHTLVEFQKLVTNLNTDQEIQNVYFVHEGNDIVALIATIKSSYAID